MKVLLSENTGWKWLGENGTYVCGFAFIGERLLSEEKLLSRVKDTKCIDEAIHLSEELNGNYALIISFGKETFVAVDHIRSIPLFFAMADGEFCVFDKTDLFQGERTFDDDCVREYLATGYVTGEDTLFQEVRQLQAGQWLAVKENCVSASGFHHKYEYQIPLQCDDDELIKRIDLSYRMMTKRLIEVLDNRTAFIPLSGGHDSRLLAYYLCEAGYRNIITYTYGRENNGEAVVSKKVAEYLHLRWHFVPYETKALTELFYDKDKYARMAEKCGNSFTVPLIQEWFAIDYLTRNHIIDERCVVVPGYSNDMLNGSHLRDTHKMIDDIEQKIIKGHYNLWGWKKSREANNLNELFASRVKQSYAVAYAEKGTKNEAPFRFEQNERFDYYERQVKHIVNAVRMYELYGIKWVLPFWDCDLIHFWLSIPLEKRENRNLFLEFTTFKYPDLMQIAPVYSSGFTQMKEKLPKNKLIMKLAYSVKFFIVAVTGRSRDKLNYYGYLSGQEYWRSVLKYKTVNYYHMFARHYLAYLQKNK